MVFVLKSLPHKRFARRGADLVHKVVLPLYQALVGASVEVQTLDNRYVAWDGMLETCLSVKGASTLLPCGGAAKCAVHDTADLLYRRRTLTLPIADIVTPGYSQVVPGEGLPKPAGGRGNLILEVDLLFPHTLSETQKMLIRSAFFLPPHPSKEQTKALRAYESAFKEPLTGWAHCLPREDDVRPAQTKS